MSPQPDFDLPLRLSPATGTGPLAGAHPVRTGIPFPRGWLKGASGPRLFDAAGRATAMDLLPLVRWGDGSVKWAELRFLAEAPAGADSAAPRVYRLRSGAADSAFPAMPMRETADGMEVETGKVRVRFSRRSPWEFTVHAGAGAFRTPEAPGKDTPMATAGPLEFEDGTGRPGRFRAESFRAESAGAAAVVLHWAGTLDGPDGEVVRLDARISLYAGSALLRAECTLWNPRPARHPGGLWDLGDPGSAFFRRLALPVRFASGKTFRAGLDPADPALVDLGDRAALRQESSGLDTWNHLIHVDRTGRPAPVFKGFRLRAASAARDLVRANPVLLHDQGGRLAALALEDFGEAFPKGLRAEVADGVPLARLEPFPGMPGPEFGPREAEGGAGDFELQGGEKARFAAWADFDADPAEPHAALAAARSPLAVTLPRDWHAASGAWGPLPSPEGGDAFLAGLVRGAVEGPESFFRRREAYEEFGWRNFGELAADHEKLHFEGGRDFVSHYNNQYDLVHSFLAHHAGTGDPRWWSLGRDLARHVIHHDLYHTRGDKPAYNGGYFWHTAHYLHAGTATHRTYSRLASLKALPPAFGGGPSNEHNYPTGLLLYHCLTGDPEARAAVLQLAGWVRDMQDGNLTVFRFASRNPTGQATCTRDPAWQGPGRGAAFSINASLDAYALTGDEAWMRQAEGFIALCIHPSDDPDAMDLLNREERWSYVVFLQALGKYLEAKLDAGCHGDAPARLARASLLRYAGWMADHEYPYLDRPEQLEYPTSTWAAQDLRKVCVFLQAARWAPPGGAQRFREKAADFSAKAVGYLRAAPDAATVRNLALILAQSTMFRHAEERGREWELGLPAPEGPYPPKPRFTPQKIQARKNILMAAATLGAAAALRFSAWLARRALGR